MTLVEACDPLMQYICRLNRSARKGVGPEMPMARGEIKALLADLKARCGAQRGLAGQFDQIEIILLYFVDFMIRASRLEWARKWQDLAHERNRLAGDEDFFDQLDETLTDPSEAASERLAVFYVCMGLGFTGWYTDQTDYLRKKMTEVSSRLRGLMDADVSARICPESYEHVNTSDLVQPPGTRLVGLAIGLIGLAGTLFAANVVMYLSRRGAMEHTLATLTSAEQGSGGEKTGGGR